MLGNTPQRETVISIDKAKSFALGMMFRDALDVPIDVTGSTIRITATEPSQWGGRVILENEAVHISEPAGYVQFKFQAEELDLRPGQYPYDITMVTPLGYSIPVVKGHLDIGPNTDPDTSNVYSDVHIGSDITVKLGMQNRLEITVERIDGMYTVIQGLIEDFRQDINNASDKAEAEANRAAQMYAQFDIDLAAAKAWMASLGFPYWKGNATAYAQLTPDPNILYLITQ